MVEGSPGLGLPSMDGAWGGAVAGQTEFESESDSGFEMLSALRSGGEPPADAAAVVNPVFASADIRPRETGARSRTPVLVEEEVAVVPLQLQKVVDLDVPEVGLVWVPSWPSNGCR